MAPSDFSPQGVVEYRFTDYLPDRGRPAGTDRFAAKLSTLGRIVPGFLADVVVSVNEETQSSWGKDIPPGPQSEGQPGKVEGVNGGG